MNYYRSQTGRIENPRVAGRELRQYVNKEFENKKYAADRIAITEAGRVQIAIQEQSYKDNGITQYLYLAEPSACDICSELDGKIFNVSDMRPGENAPVMHPHCKCSTSSYYDATELDKRLEELSKT